jgi:hypothetical protein
LKKKMRTRHSEIYERIAVRAAEEAGIPDCTPVGCAADPSATAIRDTWWEEYERQLRDDRTWTLQSIVNHWGEEERKIKICLSSVHRDRKAIQAAERHLKLLGERAKVISENLGDGAPVLEAMRKMAAQKMFAALECLPEDALENMPPEKLLRLFSEVSNLSRADSLSRLREQMTAKLQLVADQAKKIAAGATGDVKAQLGELADQILGVAK